MKQVSNTRFFSFEGIDFSGKSTQIELLRTFLQARGEQVFVLREPGGSAISEKIRTLLLDKKNGKMSDFCEIFLYSAARTQLVSEKIIPLLTQGYYVIADRYVDSTTAYQGWGRGIDANIVEQINATAVQGVMPRLTFLLEIDPEVSYRRRGNSGRSMDRLEESGIAFFKRVAAGYKTIASQNPQRIRTLRADAPVEDIQRRIIDFVLSEEK